MHILKARLIKSDNFWLYTILHNIIDNSNFDYKSFIENQPIIIDNSNFDYKNFIENQPIIKLLKLEILFSLKSRLILII